MEKVDITMLPSIYIKIARWCVSIKDLELGLIACNKGIDRFPKESNIYLIKGEILVHKFNHDKNPEHLKLAMEGFEKVLSINPHNYLAKYLSAQIYIVMDKHEKAKERLISILATAPDDSKALNLLKTVERYSVKDTGEKPKVKMKISEAEKGKDVSIEEPSIANHEVLISKMSVFYKIDGILAIFLVDPYGTIIKRKYNKSGIDEDLLATMIANIFRSSQNGVQRINLGNFKMGMIMCPIGNLYIANLQDSVIAILADMNTNQSHIEHQINKYLKATIN
ncbi:MAG: tetratricopeptide repeat protein [Nitrospinota bacterium]